MFIIYDRLVEHRQNVVLMKALHSSLISSSLSPESVADRLFQKTVIVAAAGEFPDTKTPCMTNHYDSTKFRSTNNNKNQMKSFLESSITKSKIHNHQNGSHHFQ